MKISRIAMLLVVGMVAGPWVSATAANADSGSQQSVSNARQTSSSATQQADQSSSSSEKKQASSQKDSDSDSSDANDKSSKPALSPTGYVEALLPSLSVARDLGHNCQAALASNASDKKICDQFERSLGNLAQRQKKIESTTPRPKDTSSVSPHLMKEFKGLQSELKKESLYLRAYRATQ